MTIFLPKQIFSEGSILEVVLEGRIGWFEENCISVNIRLVNAEYSGPARYYGTNLLESIFPRKYKGGCELDRTI